MIVVMFELIKRSMVPRAGGTMQDGCGGGSLEAKSWAGSIVAVEMRRPKYGLASEILVKGK
jgi:hypothetical protein